MLRARAGAGPIDHAPSREATMPRARDRRPRYPRDIARPRRLNSGAPVARGGPIDARAQTRAHGRVRPAGMLRRRGQGADRFAGQSRRAPWPGTI